MKRPAKSITGYSFSDPLMNFSGEQLRLIGSVAMVYNAVENLLYLVAGRFIGYPGDVSQITRRINGTDGIVEIAKVAIKRLPPIATNEVTLCDTLSYFSTLKTYRDAVVHSVAFDVGEGIAEQRGRRGTLQQVLLTKDALNWLLDQMTDLRNEIEALSDVAGIAVSPKWSRPEGDRQRKRVEEGLLSALAQHLHCQSLRKRERKPPQFPDERDLQPPSHPK